MDKPVVLYGWEGKYPNPKVGHRCIGPIPINHPSLSVSNTRPIITSLVIRVGSNGEFETENTIYKANQPILDN